MNPFQAMPLRSTNSLYKFIAVILLLGLNLVAKAQEWEVVPSGGRDYITLRSLKGFYQFTGEINSQHASLRNKHYVVQARVGHQDLLINDTKFVLSFPIIEKAGRVLISRVDLCKLVDPVLRPGFISESIPFTTVIIDPGHGGSDPGAKSKHGYEKNYSLKLGKMLAEEMKRRGFKVLMTRSGDTALTLSQRVRFANKVEKAIFVSLHFNSAGASTASGLETYALSPFGTASTMERRSNYNHFEGNRRDAENIALATAVHAVARHKTNLIDRGIKRARWQVLTGIQHPAILFEGGFLTNPKESALINSDSYLLDLSGAIGRGITNYRRAIDH